MGRIATLLLVIVLFSVGAQSQEKTRQKQEQSSAAELSGVVPQTTQLNEYRKTLEAIKIKRPEIPDDVLSLDIKTIDGTLPVIKAKLEVVGLEEIDASAASLDAWKAIRLQSPLQPGKPMN